MSIRCPRARAAVRRTARRHPQLAGGIRNVEYPSDRQPALVATDKVPSVCVAMYSEMHHLTDLKWLRAHIENLLESTADETATRSCRSAAIRPKPKM